MKNYLVIIFLMLFACSVGAQSFRVIGYLPHYRFDYLDKINFSHITHLNIAFANPDMQGNLTTKNNDIRPAVTKAHEHNVKVLISLAGGYLNEEWRRAWKRNLNPINRSAFVGKIIDYVYENDLDGVDVDLEWKYVDEYYNGFILELRDSLTAHNKLLSAAMPGKFRYKNMNNEALQAFDFINLMAYDATGPWCGKRPGPHSSLAFAESCLNFWIDKQGVDPNKLSLGLPLYGYCFNNPSKVKGFYYSSMICLSPENQNKDQVGGKYYNGIPTIKAKTQMAMDRVGGVMLWELSQDALDTLSEYSLLSAVNSVTGDLNLLQYRFQALNFTIYPNPNSHFVYIETNESEGDAEVHIYDTQGQLVLTKKQDLILPVIQMETSGLNSGVYYCTVKIGNRKNTQAFIKS